MHAGIYIIPQTGRGASSGSSTWLKASTQNPELATQNQNQN